MFGSLTSIFLGFSGFLLSFFLYHKKRSQREPFVCPLHGNCSDVIQSDYSTFLRVPVEVIGLVYYAFISVGYGFALGMADWFVLLDVSLLVASTAAFFFSLYLTFIQLIALRKLCTWCLLSATLCCALFVLGVLSNVERVAPVLDEWRPVLLIAHVLSATFGLGAATLAHVFFFKFLKDRRISEQESAVLSRLSEYIWLALGCVLITGAALFIPDWSFYVTVPAFLTKVIVFAVIIVSGAFLHLSIVPKLVRISFGEKHHHREGELGRARRFVFAIGPASIVSWYSVFALSILPSNLNFSFVQLIERYVVILLIAIVLGQCLDLRLSRCKS